MWVTFTVPKVNVYEIAWWRCNRTQSRPRRGEEDQARSLPPRLCVFGVLLNFRGRTRTCEDRLRPPCCWLSFGAARAIALPPATPEKLPRWRGFNLLEKFSLGRGQPFVEDDFRLIAQLGIQLRPSVETTACGSKTAIGSGSTRQRSRRSTRPSMGGKYGIHVWINSNRAPGYTVAQAAGEDELWCDPDTQRVCAKHWAMFARRYKGIPSERLGFNLMNEPAAIEPEVYVAGGPQAGRGDPGGRSPAVDHLRRPRVGPAPAGGTQAAADAQATRGYAPGEIKATTRRAGSIASISPSPSGRVWSGPMAPCLAQPRRKAPTLW